MKLTRLLKDDDAVSPVIGVILMVAITVILAAVIASFVLGLGNSATNTSPQASFGWDYEEDGTDVGELTISHDGGDTLTANELFVRGSGFDSSNDADTDLEEAGAWSDTDGAVNSYGGTSEITSGSRIVVGVASDYDLDVVWESQEGSTSSTLSSDDGPDA